MLAMFVAVAAPREPGTTTIVAKAGRTALAAIPALPTGEIRSAAIPALPTGEIRSATISALAAREIGSVPTVALRAWSVRRTVEIRPGNVLTGGRSARRPAEVPARRFARMAATRDGAGGPARTAAFRTAAFRMTTFGRAAAWVAAVITAALRGDLATRPGAPW